MLMATLLARMPDLRRRVLTQHASDGSGYCRDCRETHWPCELYEIAATAERLDARRLPLSA